MNNKTKSKGLSIDTRRFLTDEEFENLKKEFLDIYHKAAELIPEFDSENIGLTDDQVNEFQLKFICHDYFPFTHAVRKFGNSLSICADKNRFYRT